jgi:hypothetical protein
LKFKVKDYFPTEIHDFTDYEIKIDDNDRNDVAFYVKVTGSTLSGWATTWVYQNIDLKPDDGCDVVITDAFLVINPSYYNCAGKLSKAYASIGTADFDKEIKSSEFTNLTEGKWGDYKASMYTFLPAGTYALGVTLHPEYNTPIGVATAVIDAGMIEFRYFHTKLSLSASPTQVKRGESVTFSGSFTKKDAAVPNAMIYIKGKAPDGTEQTLLSTTTGSDGKYSINWAVPTDIKTGTWTVWAESSISASPPVTVYSKPITLNLTEKEGAPPAPPTIPWEYIALGALVLGAIGIGAALGRRE